MMQVQPMSMANPVSPEMNLYFYYQEIVDSIEPLPIEILEFLVSSGTSRGWFPTVEKLRSHFSDSHDAQTLQAALDDLVRYRLLHLDSNDSDRIQSIVGGIVQTKTAFRVMTADKVAFYVGSALDALTIAPTLQKAAQIRTQCGATGEPIVLDVDAEGSLTASDPHETTLFMPGWDGVASIPETLASSHFFCNNEVLSQWQSTNNDPVGLPLTQDTIRSVGMEMSVALSALYIRMSIS
jgi:hypothetical protein